MPRGSTTKTFNNGQKGNKEAINYTIASSWKRKFSVF